MQRHRSSLCMSFHGTFADARRFQGLGAITGDCPQLSLPDLRPANQALMRWAHQLVEHAGAGIVLVARALARPAGVVLYVALAVVVMALLLRMAGLPASPSLPAVERPWVMSQDDRRSSELDGHAQAILSALARDGRIGTVGDE